MAEPRPRNLGGCLITLLGALAGGAIGLGLAPLFDPPVGSGVRVVPYPHHVPKYPGGVSLRFAMVHDILHERYARHGPAYYRERNRRVRDELKGLPPGEKADALTDDLGAGLDHLGEHDEAVRVLRDKLADQTRRGQTGRALYTSYANLGTFLIHGSFRAATAGDADAKARLREELDLIHQAIKVNPEAHFGREQWQAAAVEFLLVVMDKPDLLREFDLIGNQLYALIDPRDKRPYNGMWLVTGNARRAALQLQSGETDFAQRHFAENSMTQVGADPGWPEKQIPSHGGSVPFDEPVLGIIGMWRQGGGANPHFALCLGETMLRVGERYLAWTAFERAHRLAERFWLDPALQEFVRIHSRRRQKIIEDQLPPEDVERLRPGFEAELAHGEQYQGEYQQYEADQIAKGASIDDPHFYDEFHAGRPPIATPVGVEDELRVQSELGTRIGPFFRRTSAFLGGAGVGALALALLWRQRSPKAVQ